MNLPIPNLLLQVEPVAAAAPPSGLLGNLSALEITLLVAGVIVILSAAMTLTNLLITTLKYQQAKLLASAASAGAAPELVEKLAKPTSLWKTIYDKLNGFVPTREQEEDLMLDHDYDGVRELDNDLPPWWKGVFYISMAFAPFYLYFNHFADSAQSSHEAYAVEMQEAEADVKAFLATQEDAVDETNVIALTDADALSKGKLIYENRCTPCHGKLGEGSIGPNLTDEFWLHGGSIADVFKTVKYGVPDKGMIAWKNELRPRDIQEVSSYIMTLVGTNPANAKEPQGEKYIVEESTSTEPTVQDKQTK